MYVPETQKEICSLVVCLDNTFFFMKIVSAARGENSVKFEIFTLMRLRAYTHRRLFFE